ncbi:glycosyltransferase [Candidatus Microgenomates bacterium]|nr:glycosyltransferase [Candidatus Microgenomates bacterium]
MPRPDQKSNLQSPTSKLKIALVHDWFNQTIGGAERVALELADMFPEAPIYTLIFNQTKFASLLNLKRIHTASLTRLAGWLKRRPRYLLPRIPKAVASFNFDAFDIVVSSSSAFVKNIRHSPQTFHICYCHTPMRFAWDYGPHYLAEQRLDPLRRAYVKRLVTKIRQWDLQGSQGVDLWLANSRTVAARIKKFYGQSAQVVYPPVDTATFQPLPSRQKQAFYITLGTLTPYKKIDLVITACNLTNRPLVVVGEGPEKSRLQKLAAGTIKFTGYVDATKKRKLLAQARALIFPSEEDFGIAPIEAMASGTPVVAYRKGGLTETVIDQRTGIFFDRQTPQALNEALDAFEQMTFMPADLTRQARLFDRSVFRRQIAGIVDQVAAHHVKTN